MVASRRCLRMDARSGAVRRRQAEPKAWVIFLMVALAAYSSLWVSERISEARTRASAGETSAVSTKTDGSWRAAKKASPGGDPRRVLYAAESNANSCESVHTVPTSQSTACAKKAASGWFLASTAAP